MHSEAPRRSVTLPANQLAPALSPMMASSWLLMDLYQRVISLVAVSRPIWKEFFHVLLLDAGTFW